MDQPAETSRQPSSSAPAGRGGVAGMGAALAAAGVAFVPGIYDVMRGEWLYNTQAVQPAAAFGIAAAGGMLAARVSACMDTWPRRAGLLMAALALAVTQSLLLSHRMAIGWEPVSLGATLVAGTVVAGMRTRSSAGAARWFSGRLSRETVQRLTSVKNTDFLQPDQREAAVLTCRILNETRLRTQMPAKEFLKVTEAFRLTATRLLMQHGALLDQTESGTVRAFFGLPLMVDNHADRAAAAALALADALHQVAIDHMHRDYDHVEFGTGITCGVLTAGLSGDAYTAAGDAVDQSRWLAAQNTEYHSAILTDGATHRLADNTEDRPLEILNPPEGAAVEVFQLLATKGGLSLEAMARRDAFRDAITLLRAGHAADAMQRFEDARRGLTVTDSILDRFVAMSEEQAARDGAVRRPLPPPPSFSRQPRHVRKVPRP